MCAVRPDEVIDAHPVPQLGLEIDVALVAEKLMERLFVGPVGTFDFSFQLGRARLDVGVTDAEILDMPVECRLEPRAIIRCPTGDFIDFDERGS